MSIELPLERFSTYLRIVKEKSLIYNLNPDLVLAIIFQESTGHFMSYRYERKSNITVMPNVYSRKLFIPHDTEFLFQNTSWGLMHVMGFKARELGFEDHLPLLLQPELAIEWGCKALASFKKKYAYEKDYIAAYNGGPGAVIGKTIAGYKEDVQKYVEEVVYKWSLIEKEQLFL